MPRLGDLVVGTVFRRKQRWEQAVVENAEVVRMVLALKGVVVWFLLRVASCLVLPIAGMNEWTERWQQRCSWRQASLGSAWLVSAMENIICNTLLISSFVADNKFGCPWLGYGTLYWAFYRSSIICRAWQGGSYIYSSSQSSFNSISDWDFGKRW